MGHTPAMTLSVVCFRKLLASVNNSELHRDEKRPSVLFKNEILSCLVAGVGSEEDTL